MVSGDYAITVRFRFILLFMVLVCFPFFFFHLAIYSLRLAVRFDCHIGLTSVTKLILDIPTF